MAFYHFKTQVATRAERVSIKIYQISPSVRWGNTSNYPIYNLLVETKKTITFWNYQAKLKKDPMNKYVKEKIKF
jgi:hypothetical protein